MRSIESRIAALNAAIEAANADETIITADFVIVATHSEARALAALDRPPVERLTRGPVKLAIGESISATAHLAKLGMAVAFTEADRTFLNETLFSETPIS